MFNVSDTARDELKKVMANDEYKNKNLILYFMGASCSGPSLGMALDEKTDGLNEITSNGIKAYIDPKLAEYLTKIGDIKVDYVTNERGSGYTIRVGDAACGLGSCEGCGSDHE